MRPRIEWSENAGIDESVNADNGSSVTVIKKFVAENTQLLLGLFMALSLIEGAALFFEYRSKTVSEDLRRDDFTFFKQNDWVHLQTDVEVTKALIAAKCSK